MAERLLIAIWLTSENRDSHSLWRIRRDGIKHVLVSFVKTPAIDDQSLPKRRQHILVHIRQIVTPADRSDLLLTGSLANEHRNVAPGHPSAGDRVKQIASRPNRELRLITKVVTSNSKTAVRVKANVAPAACP